MGDLSSAGRASPEELAAVRESYRKFCSRPEAQKELEQLGERIQEDLGSTGHHVYDGIARRVEGAKLLENLRDQPFIENGYN